MRYILCTFVIKDYGVIVEDVIKFEYVITCHDVAIVPLDDCHVG